MSEQNKHIDDFFREKMGDHTEAPPSFVWKSLEQKLDSTVTPATVVSYYKWLRYGIILSVLVVLVYLSGRKLMDMNDTKQPAPEQVAGGNGANDKPNAVAGNAVAVNSNNASVNNTSNTSNTNNEAQVSENSVSTAQGTQTAGAQTTLNNNSQTTPSANAKLLAANNANTITGNNANRIAQNTNTNPANNNVVAAGKSTVLTQGNSANATANNTTGNRVNVQTNSNVLASNSKVVAAGKGSNAKVGNSNNNSGSGTGNKIVAAANITNGAAQSTNTYAAKGNNARNTGRPTANAKNAGPGIVTNHTTISTARASQGAKEAKLLAANTNNTGTGNKANAVHNRILSNRINKSNLRAYAGKGKSEEYAQNSLQNKAAERSTGSKRDNMQMSTAPDKKNTNNSIASYSNPVDNNAAGKGGNAASQPATNSVNATPAAATKTTAAQAASSNAPATTNNAGQPANNIAAPAPKNNKVQDINPAASSSSTVNKDAGTKTVSTPEFINSLANKATAKKKVQRPVEMEAGVKLGFEMGFQRYQANKYILAAYLQYGIGRWALALQPAFKVAHNTHTGSLGDNQNYYSVTNQPYYTQLTDTINPANNIRTRTFSYSETHDSIVVGHQIDTKSFGEIELPILFKYKATKSLSVFGGVLLNYSNTVIRIKEDKQVFSRTGNYIYRDSFNANNTAPSVPEASTVFNYSGIAYAKYTNAGYEDASSMKLRTGYMLGASYTIHDKFMIDVSLQQNLSNMNYVPNEKVKGIYTQPYVRITAGYKLFKNRK